MNLIRSFIIFVKIFWHTSVTLKHIKYIYSEICALDYDCPQDIEGGVLTAFGTTVYFMGHNGDGFAVNEGERGELIAQVLKDKGLAGIKGEFVFRERRYIKSYEWIENLIELHKKLINKDIFRIRQKEIWECSPC